MMDEKLTVFLRSVFPEMDKADGHLIWDILENCKLIVDGEDICGGFRYNAGCISDIVCAGTTYMTFYCSSSGSPKREDFIKRIKEAGGEII
jgi:hypothetical protein